jgi:hypothetical protein
MHMFSVKQHISSSGRWMKNSYPIGSSGKIVKAGC